MSKKGTSTPSKVKTQQEEAARIKAEQLLSSSSASSSATPKAKEATLEESLAAIDRRAKERAAEEKAALAKHYLVDAQAKFKRLLSNTKDEDLKAAYEELLKIEKMAGAGHILAESSAPSGGKKKRSKEELKADAEKIVHFLRSNPNSKASDVKAVADFGISLKEFVEKYTDTKIAKEGSLSNMTYSIK